MTARSTDKQSFTIERRYDAAPARVFAAWADPVAKRSWFTSVEGFTTDTYRLDFRVGGEETWRGNAPDGSAITNDTVLHDIVADERIVFAYRMTVNGAPISVSLTTVELRPDGAGTRLVYTEHGVFLDGYDNVAGREEGCTWLLDRLATHLGAAAAA